MTRADMDRDKAKNPGELKKELAEMVGRVADGQGRDRMEGFKMAQRYLIRLYGEQDGGDIAAVLSVYGRKIWGHAFDA